MQRVTVETAELTKVFGNIRVVDRITFKVVEGEVFGFLGPNGAGKTTTTRALVCLLKPTSAVNEAWLDSDLSLS